MKKLASIFALTITTALAACGAPESSIVAELEPGQELLALDDNDRLIQAVREGTVDAARVRLYLASDSAHSLFVREGDRLRPVRFERHPGDEVRDGRIPANDREIDIGRLRDCERCRVVDAVEPERNPMERVDSDRDGRSDYDDDDDDGDDVRDRDDRDRDGNGRDDVDERPDRDDDGRPDVVDERPDERETDVRETDERETDERETDERETDERETDERETDESERDGDAA